MRRHLKAFVFGVLFALALPLAALAQTSIIAPDGQTIPNAGAKPAVIVTAATANCSSVKSSPGVLYMITSASTSNQPNFIRLYDLATTPVATAQVPKLIIAMQASNNVNPPNPIPPIGLSFTAGIGICITASSQATDNGLAATAGASVSVGYK